MAVMLDSTAIELSISVENSFGRHKDMPSGVKIPLQELHPGEIIKEEQNILYRRSNLKQGKARNIPNATQETG